MVKVMQHIRRVGQNHTFTPYTTVYLVISLPKIPKIPYTHHIYTHHIYKILANPTHTVLWVRVPRILVAPLHVQLFIRLVSTCLCVCVCVRLNVCVYSFPWFFSVLVQCEVNLCSYVKTTQPVFIIICVHYTSCSL